MIRRRGLSRGAGPVEMGGVIREVGRWHLDSFCEYSDNGRRGRVGSVAAILMLRKTLRTQANPSWCLGRGPC